MSLETRINVVLMWHMHQPQYRNIVDDSTNLPWTLLHCIKDYCDMANIFDECKDAKAVFNFSTVLLEQISNYQIKLEGFFNQGKPTNDILLDTLGRRNIPSDNEFRLFLIKQCVRANENNLINRYPSYKVLVELAREILADTHKIDYFSESFFFELVTWYHLAWLGETIKLNHKEAIYLLEKQRSYSYEDRIQLLHIIFEIVSKIIPKYRQLQEDNRIEISFTPDNHPILPLLIDFRKAKEALPEVVIPENNYPCGSLRAVEHIKKGRNLYIETFDSEPSGCWPSEGGICVDTLKLFDEHHISWAASGGGVLHNSLSASHQDGMCIHHAFRFNGADTTCFFRDDNLSDLIGFTYHNWNADDAVNNLIHHIIGIRNACNSAPDSIIPIILDGENCWEHYPANGYYFLKALYTKLGEHPDVNLTTFSDYLTEHKNPTHIETMISGSWVYGNFSTWIGNEDKNRGWELLIEVKKIFDHCIHQLKPELQQQAMEQLAICEASDWFWWFGDYNASDSVSDFDQLYRMHLLNLYRILGVTPPEVLKDVISTGKGAPERDGTMRRGIR